MQHVHVSSQILTSEKELQPETPEKYVLFDLIETPLHHIDLIKDLLNYYYLPR